MCSTEFSCKHTHKQFLAPFHFSQKREIWMRCLCNPSFFPDQHILTSPTLPLSSSFGKARQSICFLHDLFCSLTEFPPPPQKKGTSSNVPHLQHPYSWLFLPKRPLTYLIRLMEGAGGGEGGEKEEGGREDGNGKKKRGKLPGTPLNYFLFCRCWQFTRGFPLKISC